MKLKLSLIAALIVVASACLPAAPPWSGDGPRVAIFGDSLIWRLEVGLNGGANSTDTFFTDTLVSQGYSASVTTLVGASTVDLAGSVPTIPSPGADVLVIALGTNDMRLNSQGQPSISVSEAIQNVETAITTANADCVVVVTIAETAPWGLDQFGPVYNNELRSLPNVVVADWALIVTSHPEFLGSDGVHHKGEGMDSYQELILTKIEDCLT